MRPPNGLEMSRPAGEGKAAWAETSRAGTVRSAWGQPHVKDPLAGRPESITRSWRRDPAGQVGSIELLGARKLRDGVDRGYCLEPELVESVRVYSRHDASWFRLVILDYMKPSFPDL